MGVIHRGGDGEMHGGPTWPALVERLIQEALDRGDFDDLPGRGRPLAREDDTYAGEMALAFQVLRVAGVAPPWIEADKEVRRLRDERDRLIDRARRATPLMRATYRRQLVEIIEAHDRAVEQVNTQAPTERQHRRRMVESEELARLDAAWGAGAAALASEPDPGPSDRRG